VQSQDKEKITALDARAKAQLSEAYNKRNEELEKRWKDVVLPSLREKYSSLT